MGSGDGGSVGYGAPFGAAQGEARVLATWCIDLFTSSTESRAREKVMCLAEQKFTSAIQKSVAAGALGHLSYERQSASDWP